MTDTFTHIGEVISYIRKEQNMSQAELADGICSREYIGQIEKGNKFPTTYMINQFCDKLDANIYDEYALLLQHGGFTQHQMIMTINDHIKPEKGHLLLDLVTEYENSGVPIEGELFQSICYAKALYYGNIERQIEKAIAYCLDGIHTHYPDFTIDSSFNLYRLNNIEVVLLQCLFNQYYRIGDITLCILGQKKLHAYLSRKLLTTDYIVHKKLHFELTGLALLSHNIFICGQNDVPFSELLNLIENSISLLKTYGYSENLPKLLFDRTYLHYKLEDIDAYEASLSEAITISKFFVGEEKTNDLITWLEQKK